MSYEKNYISLLQEFCQKHSYPLPHYEFNDVPGLTKSFICKCSIADLFSDQSGCCPNKSQAKKDAAYKAYLTLIELQHDCMPKPEVFNGRSEHGVRALIESGNLFHNSKLLDEDIDPRNGNLRDYKQVVLVDLENLPQAGRFNYPKTARVFLVMSHNHAFYCSPAGKFLDSLASHVTVEVVRSSLKDAADHYLTWLAAICQSKLKEKRNETEFIVVSRDISGACTTECIKMNGFNARHLTNIRDLESVLSPY